MRTQTPWRGNSANAGEGEGQRRNSYVFYIPRPTAGISRPLLSLNVLGAIVKDRFEVRRQVGVILPGIEWVERVLGRRIEEEEREADQKELTRTRRDSSSSAMLFMYGIYEKPGTGYS